MERAQYHYVYYPLLVTILLFLLLPKTCLSAAPSGLNVYLAKGKGAVTILDKKNYQEVYERIFAAHKLTIDTTSGTNGFLDHLFSSNLAYLSMHANPNLLQVGNGDKVYVVDVSKRYREVGRAPGLVIVVGCRILENSKNNIARALRIEPDSTGKAFIGFTSFTPGLFCDRYFRVFLAAWLKTKPDKSYRTLEEARVYAREFIENRIAQGYTGQGEIGKFMPLDARVAGWFKIIGDSGLRVTDLGQQSGVPGGLPPTPGVTPPRPNPVSGQPSPPVPSGRKWKPAW